MSYFNNSIRKFSDLISSLQPASVLGKRKAGGDGDFDQDEESSDFAPEHSPTTCEYASCRDRDPYDDDWPPMSKDHGRFLATLKKDSVLQNADGAMWRAQAAMGKRTITETVEPEETDIQEELLAQETRHQQEDERPATRLKTSKLTPANTKTSRTVKFSDVHVLSDAESVPKVPSPTSPRRLQPWNCISSDRKWATMPNRRAREVLSSNNSDATALLQDLHEPASACHDIEIRDGLLQLTTQIRDLAAQHFSFTADPAKLRSVMESLPKETVRIIGSVASGGPGGAKGWEDLFLDTEKRKALVCAIVGNVLVEQVFQHLFYGGTQEQINAVAALQFEHRHADGFDRTALYARKIRTFLTPQTSNSPTTGSPQSPLLLPTHFTLHTSRIVAALSTHLFPLLPFSLSRPRSPISTATTTLLPLLHALTTLAALLSLHMRLSPLTYYHFPPSFKNTPFSASEMTCLNHADMQATHPRGEGEDDGISAAEERRRAGLSGEERARMQRDEALVQVSCFPGVVAFRRGGFESSLKKGPGVGLDSAAHTLEHTDVDSNGLAQLEQEQQQERQDQDQGPPKGLRTRRLTHSIVFARWGRPREWDEAGKPADVPEKHGDAWGEGGFVEFFPGVEGVVDPRGEK